MRSFCKGINRLTLLLLASGLLWTTAPAAERTDYTKTAPDKHSISELANATTQIVIDSTWDYVTLDSGEVCTTAWIQPQSLYRAYANLATYVIDLDSGSVSVRFEKYYWAQMERVGYLDSTCMLWDQRGQAKWTPTAPLDVLGQWDADVPILGGKKFRLMITAHSDDTGFRHGMQVMRQ